MRPSPCTACRADPEWTPTPGFRILVTGSRTWRWPKIIYAALAHWSRPHADAVVIEGRCPKGADHHARFWCARHNFTAESHPAAWNGHDKSMGHQRNQHMVDLGADVCLEFNHNNSDGAKGCGKMAARKKIHVARFLAKDTPDGPVFWWDAADLPRDPALLP
jgi:hypothetical protein